VRQTQHRLRDALVALIHEKPYDSTFVLALNWWADTQSPLTPREIDDVFLALVGPALEAAGRG